MKKLIMACVISVASASAFASDAAWVFAHRANSEAAINAAKNDLGINAIEIDVSHVEDVPTKKRCSETWCAYHSGDSDSTNLSTILSLINNNRHLGAVWLDLKSTSRTEEDYVELVKTVKGSLGTGLGTVRKFWGVWPASKLNTDYVTTVRHSWDYLGGKDENLFIIEADSNSDTYTADKECKKWGLQCGLSTGNPFIGDLGTSSGPSWDMQNINYLSGDIKNMSNINSVFMWTFNWSGPYEDDMMRLLFGHRSYWEYLAGWEWQCGQEGNGVIVGAMNSVYYGNFCSETDGEDACSTALSAIASGPNYAGNRYSNIGAPRNSYQSASAHRCDAYEYNPPAE
ncbi:hypothetical protein [Pleionea sp. CnH1-48]|uniref:hypothetical protein n=1 Tax=Pleionea sp. CnH1-48 TaxID=2954494 RepID=UPI0020970D31|nr:hypothetical protein [Pleionea sp. CnH1-48]MCO7223662.1 hypothetical protein [Pleionea sp. CnH1-48]